MDNVRERAQAALAPIPVEAHVVSSTPIKLDYDQLPTASASNFVTPGARHQRLTGDKFAGGFGETKIFNVDYWTLRLRSDQIFEENLYARGIIRRLVTNEVNVGLTPDVMPMEKIIGVVEDSLNDWAEDVEDRFALWARNPKLCDWNGLLTFGAIQEQKRLEALVGGDVLVVMRQNQRTRLPSIQLIRGSHVRTPLWSDYKPRKGHYVKHGVEFNPAGKVVAYHVLQKNLKSKRLPAYGEKSGRRIAWLEFGTDKRLDAVRGQPLLSIALQSLKEIDRYRDSVQRKAIVNSMLAMFIKKTEDKMGTLPISNGAVRRGDVTVDQGSGDSRRFNIADMHPGMIMEELQQGEEPVGFNNNGTDSEFGNFEQAILHGIAWANEIPPEILTLAFSNNYSASQAAINEFKIYLHKRWVRDGDTFCTPVYVEWLLSEVLSGRIKAPGLLKAWRDPQMHDVFAAYTYVDWYGSIKPSTDMLKAGKGSQLAVKEAWSTNAREARALTGTSFRKNVKQLTRENTMKAEALRPLMELAKEFGVSVEESTNLEALQDNIIEAFQEHAETAGIDEDFIAGVAEVIQNVG